MKARKITRREFLRLAGAMGGVSLLASCAPIPAAPAPAPAAPATPAAPQPAAPQWDLTDPKQVGSALEAEGAEVSISSWGFSGLPETHFIPKFAELTKQLYGVPVKLNWVTGVIDEAFRELPAAGKTVADIGLDVVDKEEDMFDVAMALNWYEPIDMDIYKPLLPNLKLVEEPYIFRGSQENGGDIYGAVYQGYEWLQPILRKDKVDVSNYVDWTDLARPELEDKIIDYPFNDQRGQFVFAGLVSSLVQQKLVPGPIFSQEAWKGALQWWKDNNMEKQIHKWGDIGNDPTMRLMLQSGEAWAACTWGVYTRELLGTDWNKRDDVLWPFYPKSGMLANRETCAAVRKAKHPVAARILINWMLSIEFNTAGWYKESPTAEAVNRWGISESLFLVTYTGGVYQAMRDAMPDWAKPYYLPDPGSLILRADWKWLNQNSEWVAKTYESIVHGA
jgi:spermidine/putrescine-binding protein